MTTLVYSSLAQPTFPGNWTTQLSAGSSGLLLSSPMHPFDASSRFEKRIYIPLPGPEARKRMFELNVGTTPCELDNKDYRYLADMTNGYVRVVDLRRPSLLSYLFPMTTAIRVLTSPWSSETLSCSLYERSFPQHTSNTCPILKIRQR